MTMWYMPIEVKYRSASMSEFDVRRGRNRVPLVSSAPPIYSAIASAAAKCRPIVRCRPPFSLSRIVASAPSRWNARLGTPTRHAKGLSAR